MTRTAGRIAAAAAGLTLVVMLFIGSLVGALHDPVPHRIPVGVVAPPAAAQQLASAFGQRGPAAFAVTAYPSAAAARQAIATREADGVLIPASGQLLVASAAGRFVTEAVTTVFTAAAAAAHRPLTVADIRPAPPGDPNGIAQFFFFLGLALPSAAFGIALASILGRPHGPAPARELRWPGRLAALAGFAVVSGAAATWVADGLIGALPGAPAAVGGVAALTAFAVSAACCAGWRLAGPPLAGLFVLLFVPVGVAAAGGPFGPAFVASWYARLGAALPGGATMQAVRDVVSFGGNALGGPLLVLSLWAGIAAVAATVPVAGPDRDADRQGQPLPSAHG